MPDILLFNFDIVVAGAAINRFILAGFERNLGIHAAFRAHSGEHLTSALLSRSAALSICLPCLSAFRTAFRFIRETFGRIEFLLHSAESKFGIAVSASQLFVGKTHGMTS